LDINDELTDKEKSFFMRSVRRKNLFLTFSILSVVVALFFLVYHGLIIKDLNALRLVVVLLLLLSGRSHLRQYKSALIFSKLKSRLDC
jgi:hypothetical protein